MRIAIWGIGFCGRQFKRYCEKSDDYEVVVAFDNSVSRKCQWREIFIDSPDNILDYEFEKIIITPIDKEVITSIKEQIEKNGIPKDKVVSLYEDVNLMEKVSRVSSYDENDPRVMWLKNFSAYVYENRIEGEVAECGVNRGDFSLYINELFGDRKLYLFDTFEGFSKKDLEKELEFGDKAFLESRFNDENIFDDASEEYVLNRMPFPKKCEIRKGYFPDTANDMEYERFCFVNLDMDLYNPQLEGLRFFYDKMVKGGVILLHDYFNSALPGVKRAVKEFCEEKEGRINLLPIGDDCSIALVK